MPMSPTVKAKEPVIRQVFIGRGPDIMVTDALERRLYVIRRRAANAIAALKLNTAPSSTWFAMSARTRTTKGLLLATQVGEYFNDLQDPRGSALALVHQRGSRPIPFLKWNLAHPSG